MEWAHIPFSLLLLTAVVVSLLLTLIAGQRRHAPGAMSFIFLMLAVAEWSLAYTLELATGDLKFKILWVQIKYLGVVTVPAAWLSFSLQYTGRGRWLTTRHLALLGLEPIVTLLLVWTNDLHGLVWSSTRLDTSGFLAMRASTRGLWFWVNVLYSYLLVLLGTVLIIQSLIRSPHLYRGQIITLLISGFIPWIGSALYISNFNPLPNLDLTPFAFAISGLILVRSVYGFHLLDIVPVAREALIESMSDLVIVLDAQNRVLDLNPAAQRAVGQSLTEAIGQPAAKVLPTWPGLMGPNGQVEETLSEIIWGKNERQRLFDLRISPLLDRKERTTGRLIVLRDITERKQAEQGLQKAHEDLEKEVERRMIELLVVNEQLRREIEGRKLAEESLHQSMKLISRAKQEWESTVDSLPQLIFLIDRQGFILRTNRTVERWKLAPTLDTRGLKIHELFHPGCPNPTCYLEKFWLQAWEQVSCGRYTECEVADPALQRSLYFQVIPITPAQYVESGDLSNYAVVVVHDITERKGAEQEKRSLEEQLRQSQKMEAIGRLAGGIAHDFNNLLTLIKGYSQLSLLDLKEKDPLKAHIEGVKKASERAADLVHQLLAFSRRQVMEMKVLDLNALLHDLDKMLRRVIGENIELVTRLAEDLGRVKADPGQIEQVILNLAVNARDAMPSGGKFLIETTNVTVDKGFTRTNVGVSPGRYVRVSVSDTGVGMVPEVKERLFEPFFTTKEKGKGTGLGLSTVYGIVKQSGGNIWVYSEPGHGSTFKIYLPRVDEPVAEVPEKGVSEELPRGQEMVLVVEDDEEVRKLSVYILNRQGYRVWEAADGVEALKVCQQQKELFDLMVTDVVMPRMGGKELAERVQALRPQMKVLFTSGYTDDAMVHQGILEWGTNFLQKPFSPETLARKVRKVLDK